MMMCIVETVGCEDDATIAWTADSAENYCILRRRVVSFTPEASERNCLSLHAERGHRSEKSQRRVVFATSYSVTCLMWTAVATRVATEITELPVVVVLAAMYCHVLLVVS
eukprot:scaffold91_cov203-Alexandrium_tamarense.AAC.32